MLANTVRVYMVSCADRSLMVPPPDKAENQPSSLEDDLNEKRDVGHLGNSQCPRCLLLHNIDACQY